MCIFFALKDYVECSAKILRLFSKRKSNNLSTVTRLRSPAQARALNAAGL